MRFISGRSQNGSAYASFWIWWLPSSISLGLPTWSRSSKNSGSNGGGFVRCSSEVFFSRHELRFRRLPQTWSTSDPTSCASSIRRFLVFLKKKINLVCANVSLYQSQTLLLGALGFSCPCQRQHFKSKSRVFIAFLFPQRKPLQESLPISELVLHLAPLK